MPIQMTAAHIAHLRCTRLKCSTLSHRPLRHAQALPFRAKHEHPDEAEERNERQQRDVGVVADAPYPIQLGCRANSSGRFPQGWFSDRNQRASHS